jgi:hypothetical protein
LLLQSPYTLLKMPPLEDGIPILALAGDRGKGSPPSKVSKNDNRVVQKLQLLNNNRLKSNEVQRRVTVNSFYMGKYEATQAGHPEPSLPMRGMKAGGKPPGPPAGFGAVCRV